jgi:hypothetical protein
MRPQGAAARRNDRSAVLKRAPETPVMKARAVIGGD